MEHSVIALAQAGDFSLFGVMLRADWLVRAVMIALIIAAILSWLVTIERFVFFQAARHGMQRFENTFHTSKAIDLLYDDIDPNSRNPMVRVFAAGMREWTRSLEFSARRYPGLRDRLDRAMAVAHSREAESLLGRLSHLLAIALVSPFVGLFGALLGAKTHFQALSFLYGASAHAAAPDAAAVGGAMAANGAAQALMVAALGLFVAAPALLAYLQLTRMAAQLEAKMKNFAQEFAVISSREIDRREAEAI